MDLYAHREQLRTSLEMNTNLGQRSLTASLRALLTSVGATFTTALCALR